MTVVVGVPGEDCRPEPIREAARLAVGLDEPLHVVHVRSEKRFEDRNGGEGTPTFGAVRDAAAEVAAAAFERAFDGTREETIPTDGGTVDTAGPGTVPSAVDHVGLIGDPAETIMEHGAHVDASLLVVGGTRRSPVGKAVFGDVTQDVLYGADRPVVACLEDGA
ncbi:universal stress protein [Halorubrum vacuolatum]|uniref:Nucleotide-binding universal stress protein, UspA family n=1 Tax=Halorubrum vacuolatum TaxID=63740 RepID=A0A238VTZ4_HALVU|nr:universal stress protein [Halorubrum vacuolatum]SNR37661.1 Nucleotide-binding universal stress protein, UspA family [Halorubrum vacuolatum]